MELEARVAALEADAEAEKSSDKSLFSNEKPKSINEDNPVLNKKDLATEQSTVRVIMSSQPTQW